MTNVAWRGRLPDFLKQTIPTGPEFFRVQNAIQKYDLNTVCEEAKCPNRTHCYARGTLTFQILGAVCTRRCGFCAETFGKPGQPDPDEDRKLVEAIRELQLRHVVITAPARDDLADGGAAAFAHAVRRIKSELPSVTVEVLVPDFQGAASSLEAVFESRPDVFNHNVETVRRLSPTVRSRARYDRSLFVLEQAAARGLTTKSGLMVGHGEEAEELSQTFRDLRGVDCRLLTIGQYLPPSAHHLPLIRLYAPAEFDALKAEALRLGFEQVAAGPLVRSSYHAEELITQ
jgi:lipoic acid synthetase